MTDEQVEQFFIRIDKLSSEQRPLFGKMDVNQVVCHCTDFFRMAKGAKKADEYGQVDPNEIISLAKLGKPTPAPKGFGQVEGEGTRPTNLENDKKILKDHILEFSRLPVNYSFALHPYFDEMTYKRWFGLALYHLNHHLSQFDV